MAGGQHLPALHARVADVFHGVAHVREEGEDAGREEKHNSQAARRSCQLVEEKLPYYEGKAH